MSDLAATNCQSSCGSTRDGNGFCNCLLPILLLSLLSNDNNGCSCENLIWILLLLSCCGNNNGDSSFFGF